MIRPNTQFLVQRGQKNEVNLALLDPTTRKNSILFDITCAKCIRLGGCHYERIPCDYKRKMRKALELLDCDQQIKYLIKCQSMTFDEIKEDLTNIINIMET